MWLLEKTVAASRTFTAAVVCTGTACPEEEGWWGKFFLRRPSSLSPHAEAGPRPEHWSLEQPSLPAISHTGGLVGRPVSTEAPRGQHIPLQTPCTNHSQPPRTQAIRVPLVAAAFTQLGWYCLRPDCHQSANTQQRETASIQICHHLR